MNNVFQICPFIYYLVRSSLPKLELIKLTFQALLTITESISQFPQNHKRFTNSTPVSSNDKNFTNYPLSVLRVTNALQTEAPVSPE